MLAMNDGEVPFIWRWLHDKGLRVPEDISLVGFDDVGSLLNERHENILTTIQVPLEEIGRQATTLLLDMIAGKVTEETHMILPVKLIVRQSTAPPRATRALTVS
jgi:LacI family transcriptional regulator